MIFEIIIMVFVTALVIAAWVFIDLCDKDDENTSLGQKNKRRKI